MRLMPLRSTAITLVALSSLPGLGSGQEPVWAAPCVPAIVDAFALDPSGRWVATAAAEDARTVFYDATSGAVVGEVGRAAEVGFWPDGQHAVLWDAQPSVVTLGADALGPTALRVVACGEQFRCARRGDLWLVHRRAEAALAPLGSARLFLGRLSSEGGGSDRFVPRDRAQNWWLGDGRLHVVGDRDRPGRGLYHRDVTITTWDLASGEELDRREWSVRARGGIGRALSAVTNGVHVLLVSDGVVGVFGLDGAHLESWGTRVSALAWDAERWLTGHEDGSVRAWRAGSATLLCPPVPAGSGAESVRPGPHAVAAFALDPADPRWIAVGRGGWIRTAAGDVQTLGAAAHHVAWHGDELAAVSDGPTSKLPMLGGAVERHAVARPPAKDSLVEVSAAPRGLGAGPVPVAPQWAAAGAWLQHDGLGVHRGDVAYNDHFARVGDVQFGGPRMLVRSDSGPCALVDRESGRVLQTWQNHLRVALSASGQLLWGTDTGAHCGDLRFETAGPVSHVALSPDGARAATVSRIAAKSGALHRLELWDALTGARTEGWEVRAPDRIAFRTDGAAVVVQHELDMGANWIEYDLTGAVVRSSAAGDGDVQSRWEVGGAALSCDGGGLARWDPGAAGPAWRAAILGVVDVQVAGAYALATTSEGALVRLDWATGARIGDALRIPPRHRAALLADGGVVVPGPSLTAVAVTGVRREVAGAGGELVFAVPGRAGRAAQWIVVNGADLQLRLVE